MLFAYTLRTICPYQLVGATRLPVGATRQIFAAKKPPQNAFWGGFYTYAIKLYFIVMLFLNSAGVIENSFLKSLIKCSTFGYPTCSEMFSIAIPLPLSRFFALSMLICFTISQKVEPVPYFIYFDK